MPTPISAERKVPRRIVLLSLAALAVPVVGTLAFQEFLGEYAALLWLAALVPAFAFSFYQGTRGVAMAVAVGVTTLLVTQGIASWLLHPIPASLPWVVLAFLAIAMWIGIHTEYLHRERDEVEQMAFTDPLTGLPNRRHALTFLAREFAAAQRGRVVTVVIFDLDQFKQYNDTYGHAAGDEAIQAFSDILSRLTRRMNLSGRLGGEEFISILGGTESDGAVLFADRVRAAWADHDLDDAHLTVSAGVATFNSGMVSMEQLLAAADDALYEAKREGRNRVAVHTGATPSLTPAPARRRNRNADVTVGGPTRDDRPADSHPPRFQATGLGRGKRVLVVEEDPGVRSILTDYLGAEGFHVAEATDVPGAFGRLSAEFDLLVTDLRLPGGSGPDLVASAKSRWPALQVVAMTGIEGSRAAAEALRAGADSYVIKPFGVPELRRHVAEALERRERLVTQAREDRARSADAGERASQIRETVLEGVLSLVKAVEMADPYTVGHSARVAAYAAILADGLDPSGASVSRDRLKLACELHDVGKIGIPAAILNKSGGLSPDEMARVQEHPRIGRRMLEPLLDDEVVLDVANWHHERWDGTGYPDRLVGETIPLPARLVSLAVALDAMTCPRAYREAIPWAQAVARIRHEAGTGFDPAVVAAMDGVLPRLKRLYDEAPLPGSELVGD